MIPARCARTNHNGSDIWGPSPHVRLLAFMEAQPLSDSFNFTISGMFGCGAAAGNGLDNITVRESSIATFSCPSDEIDPVTGGNYAPCIGPQYNYAGNRTGMWARRSTFSLRMVPDGSSNTITFGEQLKGSNTGDPRGPADRYLGVAWPGGEANPNNFTMPTGLPSLQQFVQACNARRQSGANLGTSANLWWSIGRADLGGVMNTLLTPNSRDADCHGSQAAGTLTARSRHPGGVNVLLTDGSVRFVKDSIGQVTWWALSTRSGREVISADSY
jgi:prepilin-type processing-associated H-X9-DG protein